MTINPQLGRWTWALLPLCGVLAYYGCDERIRSTHPTLRDAQETIAKGWIPANLPPSTTNIREEHNLDVNTGYGTFEFQPADVDGFKAKLTPITAEELASHADIPTRRLEREGYQFYQAPPFFFAVHWQRHRGEYWLEFHTKMVDK